MFVINDKNDIFITRGDTASFTILVRDKDGNIYVPVTGDTLTFAVKRNERDTKHLIKTTAVDGKITLKSTDTSNLDFGNYVYDIQLRLRGGDINTIVPIHDFNITRVVN